MSSNDPGVQPPDVPPVPADADEHHREIWSDAFSSRQLVRPSVYYIENHNGPVGYAEAAFDYRLAVEDLFQHLKPTDMSTWLAPTLNLARLAVELHLKALLEVIAERDGSVNAKPLRKHDLLLLWNTCIPWLTAHSYGVSQDARLSATTELINAFHAVDPDGGLFRFAQSHKRRFGKQKSYDRAGVNYKTFAPHLKMTFGLLGHWEGVIFRERLCKEMNWERDPHFDANDFPRTNE
jgi:hypothetical protein